MLIVHGMQRTINSRDADPVRTLYGLGAAAVAERASLPRCACTLEGLSELTRQQLEAALDDEGIRGKVGKGSRWQQQMYNMERAATKFEAAGKSEHARLKREQATLENQRQFRFNFAHQQPCGQEAALPAPPTAAPTNAAATATAAPLPAAPLPAADATDAFSEWFSSSTDAEALVAFFEPASTAAATDAASVTTAAAEPSVSIATASRPSSTLPPQPPKPPEDNLAGTSTALCDATVGIDAQFDFDLEAIQAAAEAPSAAGAAGAGSKHSTQPTAVESNPAAVPVAEGVAPSGAPATHYQPCKHVFARNFIDMLRLGEHAESEMFIYSNEPIELFQCKSCPIGCGCKPTQ